MLSIIIFFVCLANSIAFLVLTQPGELLTPYTRFINIKSNLKPWAKKLLLCPYCLFTWILTICYLAAFALGYSTKLELILQLSFGIQTFMITAFLITKRIIRYINGG